MKKSNALTRPHPLIPGFVHRRKIVFAGKENGRIQNAGLVAALFFQHRVDLRQGIGGLLIGLSIEIRRYAGVVQGLVVDHNI